MGVLRSLAQQLPLPDPPLLVDDWEFLYERSAGCVGILKQWLVKALSGALRKGEGTLSRRSLESHALSIVQVDKILSEASEGEMRLSGDDEAASRLRERLGLVPVATQRREAEVSRSGPALSRRTRSRPGQRRPVRDVIGQAGVLRATRV